MPNKNDINQLCVWLQNMIDGWRRAEKDGKVTQELAENVIDTLQIVHDDVEAGEPWK